MRTGFWLSAALSSLLCAGSAQAEGSVATTRATTPGRVATTLSAFKAGASLVAPATPASGRFTLLTYNVAGLPEFISQSDPVHNMPVISGLLNLYDVALVQEDFSYHPQLSSAALHAYRSTPVVQNERTGIGDGLSVFSRLPFTAFERVTWKSCNGTLSDGSDCLASKGFTVARHQVAPGIEVDFYNLHMDSGRAPRDVRARSDQASQLLAYLAQHSKGRPVIVAGDTNMSSDADSILANFNATESLVDSCRTLHCGRPRLIDRVLYRGSSTLDLRVVRFTLDRRFVTASGSDLSDHQALGVEVEWKRLGSDIAH
jgi:endonuclease/exonuclease/phosphatase (EEP) superfamily protein YafD